MIIERRQNHRVSLTLPVRYKIFHLDQIENEIQEESFRLSAKSLDISLGGIQVVSEDPLFVGDVLELEFDLPQAGRVRTVAKMAWVKKGSGSDLGKTVCGIRFIPVYENDLEKIKVYFQKA